MTQGMSVETAAVTSPMTAAVMETSPMTMVVMAMGVVTVVVSTTTAVATRVVALLVDTGAGHSTPF